MFTLVIKNQSGTPYARAKGTSVPEAWDTIEWPRQPQDHDRAAVHYENSGTPIWESDIWHLRAFIGR